ncbi:MAG: mannose-6-phosphate isomerase, class I [Terriglobales bacterium]
MAELYPLLMVPAFDPRPWGTVDLSPIYANHRFEQKIGESWLTGDNSKVANGPLKGKSLAELSSKHRRELVGDAPTDATRFPLLLKFLFPHEKLSVQVHPDDEAARLVGEACGKTECWYVAHAKPGAQIALGLKQGTSTAEFERAIHENRAEQLLNWIDVYAGEMIYVAGGTVHTLGPGAIIVETQQQSDTTYRLYDYGRPRELHLKQGLTVMKERGASGKTLRPAPSNLNGGKNRLAPLIESPCFVVDMFELKDVQQFPSRKTPAKSSVQILVAVDGCGIVEAPGAEAITFAKGDAVVIPACIREFKVRPQWSLKLLVASVPGEQLSEPAVRM